MFSDLNDPTSRHPKCRALPVRPTPDIQFRCHDTNGEGKIKDFSVLWSFMWSKPLYAAFSNREKSANTDVTRICGVFGLTLSRIPPRHSQTRRDTNFMPDKIRRPLSAHLLYQLFPPLQEGNFLGGPCPSRFVSSPSDYSPRAAFRASTRSVFSPRLRPDPHGPCGRRPPAGGRWACTDPGPG